MSTNHDPVNSPSHYRGKSGRQSIEITHAYRLGPDLTQAVDYILRAGKKTLDPRQDLAKAAFYLRYAAKLQRDLGFGGFFLPRPTPAEVAEDFDLNPHLTSALGYILRSYPNESDLTEAIYHVEEAIEAYTATSLQVPDTPAPRLPVPHRESA